MQRPRKRGVARRVTAVLAGGVVLQAAQCTPLQTDVFAGLATSIASVFVTGYVFDQFGVAQPGFGFGF
ncbi:MAG: hypothetical protein GXP29_13060 [Planctomycetes bacterium]|nr:hypothetical protein [Planctomycetota bacterium]